MNEQTTVRRNLTNPARARDGIDPGAIGAEPTFENVTIPEHFGPISLVVDDLKIKRFAFTQDDYGDWYLRAGPYGPRIGHAALLANDLLQLFTLHYAPSLVVGLHTEEQLWFERPVELGQRVHLEGTYTEKHVVRGQGQVVMEALARDDEGRTLLRHRGVEIMRTEPGAVVGRSSAGRPAERRVTGEYREPVIDRVAATTPIGTGLTPLVKEATIEQMAVFSRVGEFVRNIHYDLPTARAGGLALPIMQGQQLACYIAELLTRSFGLAWFTGGWLRCKFIRPVSAFETVDVGGVVQSISAGSPPVAEVDVWVRGEDGTLRTVGWASCPVVADTDWSLPA